MNQDYVDTVRLLLDIAPAVFKPPRFAMKGGTADLARGLTQEPEPRLLGSTSLAAIEELVVVNLTERGEATAQRGAVLAGTAHAAARDDCSARRSRRGHPPKFVELYTSRKAVIRPGGTENAP